jgi:hypothetical protein
MQGLCKIFGLDATLALTLKQGSYWMLETDTGTRFAYPGFHKLHPGYLLFILLPYKYNMDSAHINSIRNLEGS